MEFGVTQTRWVCLESMFLPNNRWRDGSVYAYDTSGYSNFRKILSMKLDGQSGSEMRANTIDTIRDLSLHVERMTWEWLVELLGVNIRLHDDRAPYETVSSAVLTLRARIKPVI